MHLEKLAAPPPEQTAQQRYASLHRALEKGMATDVTWAQLCAVCIKLNRLDEALNAYHRVQNVRERRSLRHDLTRRGVQVAEVPVQVRLATDESQSPVRDAFEDAVHFLANDHMPVTLMALTAVFPLVVGAGGLMMRGNPTALVAVVAIPALLVTALLFALMRNVMIQAADGIDDAPRIPRARNFLPDAGRMLRDVVTAAAATIGPLLIASLCGAPSSLQLVLFLYALVFTPLAVATRTVHQSWRALAPHNILLAAVHTRQTYFAIGAAATLLLAPGAICWLVAPTESMVLRLALVGPLATAPLIVAARLLGTYTNLNQNELLTLLHDRGQPAPAQRAPQRPAAQAKPAPRRAKARNTPPRLPEDPRRKKPTTKNQSRPHAPAQRGRQRRSAHGPQTPYAQRAVRGPADRPAPSQRVRRGPAPRRPARPSQTPPTNRPTPPLRPTRRGDHPRSARTATPRLRTRR